LARARRALAGACTCYKSGRAPAGPPPLDPAASAERSASLAAAAAAYPIARLPSGGVVDASSVAVLPFGAPPDEPRATRILAASLSRDIGSALAALPGIYVVGAPRAAAYLATELDASELGEQLGVRGIVVGELAEHDGRIRIAADLLDAATDERIWHASTSVRPRSSPRGRDRRRDHGCAHRSEPRARRGTPASAMHARTIARRPSDRLRVAMTHHLTGAPG
jgi:TolB-like protein